MRRTTLRTFVLIAVLATLTLGTIAPAAARETRTLADRYTVVIGFIDEPAIQADTNGLWLRVTEGDQPIEGLEQTLQAEVRLGEVVRGLPLIPTPGEPGTYTSTFIPVQPGEYTFRISGTIGDQAVDESFTSAPEGVALVDARIDYEFPSAAQGWVRENLAMPVAAGLVLLGIGLGRFVFRRGDA